MLAIRRRFGRLPSAPRCKLCYAPFHGVGGAVLKPWFGPWERNPQLCKNCMKALTKQGVGGAEVEISMLFVDIRGSTGLGERLGPAAFAALLTDFYRLAANAIVETDGVVDKFVGDEAIGLYIPSYAGRGPCAEGDRRRSPAHRGDGTVRRVGKRADPRRRGRAHGHGVRRDARVERGDLGLHRARRLGEHDGATRVPGGPRRAARLARGCGARLARRDGSRSADGRGARARGDPRRVRAATVAALRKPAASGRRCARRLGADQDTPHGRMG